MVSGPKEAFEVVRPLMASYSQAQFWLGDGEQARYTKLGVNLILAVSAGMLGKALALARRGNVAAADVLDVIAASARARRTTRPALRRLQSLRCGRREKYLQEFIAIERLTMITNTIG
jgi:3-hydroxyisobutyrate dehydrogenase-like beta-hydroxyacid dehydrogenase